MQIERVIYEMKNLIYIQLFFLILLSSFTIGNADRTAFYEALSGQSETVVDKEIALLDSEKKTSLTNAYLGAMLMKKAGFLKGAGHKVKTFKKGAGLLEEEIKRSPGNAEFRFLRLSIQEHAPKILKYNKNLEEDRKIVVSGYEKLDPDLKKIIRKYSANSAIINQQDLQ